MWRVIFCSEFDFGVLEQEYATYLRKSDACRVGRAWMRSERERLTGERYRWYRVEYVDEKEVHV